MVWQRESTQRADRVFAVVCGLGAALLYGLTTGPLTFWLDSAEFVGVSRLGGVAHPPGSPLYTALSGISTLLPLGSIPFRVHLFSALFGALSAVGLFAVGVEVLHRLGRREVFGRLVVIGLAWCMALSPALWFQSVRAEVYTLSSAIHVALVWLALRWQRLPEEWGTGVLMALVGGFGLANHHYLAGLTGLACLAYLLMDDSIRRQLASSRLLWLVGFAVAGLATYLYLPIRAHQGWLWWGDPASAEGLVRMVSAEAFHTAVTEMPKAPFNEAVITILVKWVDLLGAPLFLFGFMGLILMLFASRREGFLLFALVCAGVVSKAIMYLDVENPDDHAYFSIGLQALAVSGVGWVWAVERLVQRVGSRGWLGCGVVVAFLGFAGAVQWSPGMSTWTLKEFVGPDVLNRHMLGSVEPGAVYMPSYYATYFNTFYYHEVEKRRPDVALLQAGFQSKYDGGKPYASDVVRRYPELSGVLGQYLESGLFPEKALAELSARRSIVLEANVLKVTQPRYEEYSLGELGLPIGNDRLVFTGPGVRLAPAAGDTGLELGMQKAYWVAVYKDLNGVYLHPELKKTLAWIHYRNALYFINRGSWISAHLEILMAKRLYPDMERFAKLEAALKVDADVAKSTTLGRTCQSPLPDPGEGPSIEELLLQDEGGGACGAGQ